MSKEVRAKKTFRRMLGYELNLDSPQTFNEKMQWLKLNDHTPLHTQCADKFEVRKYVESKIGKDYLIPLFFQSYKASDLIEQNFPEVPFILKANHDSSGGVFISDKSEIDWQKLQKDFAARLKTNYYFESGEWQYKNIKPCIIAEKLLKDEQGNIPVDFKLFCFNGKVEFIQLDLDRETDHKRNLYDREWNLMECVYVYVNGRDYEKPKVLDKMIELAEVIAQDFSFVRVDLYNIGEEIFFGEITFHPESGFGKFFPGSWDKKFGGMLRIPTDV